MRTERRWKVAKISDKQLASVRCPSGFEIRIATSDQLPEGFSCVREMYDHSFRAHFITIEHPSFDPVPEGWRAPVVDADLQCYPVEK